MNPKGIDMERYLSRVNAIQKVLSVIPHTSMVFEIVS